ncbi:MAG: hypothetical protein ACRCYZ_05145 [Alphaproteobacteria bacterium]
MNLFQKKWLLIFSKLLAANPLLAGWQDDKPWGSSAPLSKNLSFNKPMKWDNFLKKNPEDILDYLNRFPKNLHPLDRIRWHELFQNNATDAIKFLNNLPQNFRPLKRIKWYELFQNGTADAIKFFNNLSENFRPQNPIEWYELLQNSPADAIKILNDLPENFRPLKRIKWYELFQNGTADAIKFFNNLSENFRPQNPIEWYELLQNSPADALEFFNNLPKHFFPPERIEWDELLQSKKLMQVKPGYTMEDAIKFLNSLPKHLCPLKRIKWYDFLQSNPADAIKFLNGLPEGFRPQNPIEWYELLQSNSADSLEFLNGLPEHFLPLKRIKWYDFLQSNPADAVEFFNGLPECFLPLERIKWEELLQSKPADAAEFLNGLPERYLPNDLSVGIFLNSLLDKEKFVCSLRLLPHNDPKWSPSHEKSFSVLAPIFFAARDLEKDEFETWLSLTQFDRDELLRMCVRGDYFEKTDLLMPDGLDDEGLTTYLQNTLFPEGQWIGEDLQRTLGYLEDEEETPAIMALRQLVEAAIPLEGRLPQVRNQTVHASETESFYENAFKKLEEKYPNPAPLDVLTFEGICLSFDELKPEERQDALSQFKRLQREGQQKRIDVMSAAVSSLDDSDAVLSFIKGGFVGPWRMYWDMKSETERNTEIQTAGGEEAIQRKIRQGRYSACLGGSRTMLLEALAGIHPDVPLSTNEEDMYNALLMQIIPFIQKLKAEGKGPSQFWELFEEENLAEGSPMAARQAFTQFKTHVTDELLKIFFEG